MVSKKVLKNIGVFALTVVLATAPVVGASATSGGLTTKAAQAEDSDSQETPETPAKPSQPSTSTSSTSSSRRSGGGSSYSSPNVTASDGTVTYSTIGGEYAVNILKGTAIVTPKSAVAAALGAPEGASLSVRMADTQCGVNARKSIQDGMDALAVAGIPATQITAIDIYAYVNGESVIQAATPVTLQVGIPAEMQDGSQIAAILVQEGGIVTLLKDLDLDPATATFDLPGFGVLTLVKVPAGSL